MNERVKTTKRSAIPEIINGRKQAGYDVRKIVIEYRTDPHKIVGFYSPDTCILHLYRQPRDSRPILLMI